MSSRHRHQKTTETMVVLRGRVVEEYYSPDGSVEESVEVAFASGVGEWHCDPGDEGWGI